MVKGCRLPCSGVVARLASLRESAAHVVRIRGALEIFQVTRHAGRAGQVVVVADVAIDALARRHGVRTRQNESGGGVIELPVGPGHSVMTLRARGWETGMRNRRGRGVVVGLMATDAGGCGDIEVVIYVTVRTLPRRNCVRTAERESSGRVIELRVRPLHRIVALLTRSRESGVRHRAYRIVEVVLMAADACGARNIEIVIDVAICTLARGNGVRTGQRKTGLRVIESRRLPGCGGVAGFASLCESPAHVIRVRGSLEIF